MNTTGTILDAALGTLETVPGFGAIVWVYNTAKIVFIILDVLLFFILIFAFKKAWAVRPHLEVHHGHGHGHGTHAKHAHEKKSTSMRSEAVKERWQSIMKKTAGDSPDSLRIAVIEADSLVDSFLKESGLEGEHMADRLSGFNPEEVKSLPLLWKAHRMRNDLVHTPGFYLAPAEAKEILSYYEKFLKELGALG